MTLEQVQDLAFGEFVAAVLLILVVIWAVSCHRHALKHEDEGIFGERLPGTKRGTDGRRVS